jgi:hypothetical protein
VNHEIKDGNTALMAAVREDRREVRHWIALCLVSWLVITEH